MTITDQKTGENAATNDGSGSGTVTRLLQRQILPVSGEVDVLPLYVDNQPAILDSDKYEVGSNRNAQEINAASMRQSTATGKTMAPDAIESRTGVRIPLNDKLSFGTYFNAFPASYWRRWTVVTDVTLTLALNGVGATVTVYLSRADGRAQRVDSVTTEHDSQEVTFELSLKSFTDGGWLWYDVTAGAEDVLVEAAEWWAEVPAEKAERGTVTMAITTMNRPDFCARLLHQIGEDAELAPVLDRVLVMEQGKQKVVDSEHFGEARDLLGEKLRIIEQGNLGGSGGYARGQLETLKADESTYAMMMDDDVECEPEGILRALTFGDLCRRPTIVGGHMFSLYAKSRMHSFGEKVEPYRFWWGSAPGVFGDWDFGARNLRSTRWLHARVDVDYNGWFMCLIPTVVMREIGLSLPIFIKWDDSEYGLRAKRAGYPTVSFPGAAVWHIPWTDKNDGLDWQSYFHQRNRFIAALLHSKYPNGGRMVVESFNHQIKHLVCMQYSTVELRHQALLDVLDGPDHLHGVLGTKLGEVRAMTKGFDDATLESDPDAFPEVKRTKLPRKGREGTLVPRRRQQLTMALLQPLRQLRPVRDLAKEHPEASIPAMDAKWYHIGRFDSAVVSMPDGNSRAFYRRDPERFRELLQRTIEIHQRLRREWPRLSEEYRAKLGEITSPEAWEETFEPYR